MWRSLVARTLGVGEAPSSNLGIPIRKEAFNCLPVESLFRFSSGLVRDVARVAARSAVRLAVVPPLALPTEEYASDSEQENGDKV